VIEPSPLAQVGLVLVRPGLLVMAAPVFGGVYVPPPVRVGLTVLLAVVIAPAVPHPRAIGEAGLVAVIASELLIGLALAMGLRVLFSAANLAGYLAGFQMGLSYAAIVDPQTGVRNNVLATLYANLALVTFFGINGHHALIRALAGSYDAVPIGAGGVSGPLAGIVAELLGMIFVTGVRLAAPVVTALLLVELALGLVSRAAPALNLMVVGTPLRLLAGMSALAVGVQVVPSVVSGAAGPALEAALRLVGALS
jgi:flagellar biosynthetic protein FliR